MFMTKTTKIIAHRNYSLQHKVDFNLVSTFFGTQNFK